MDTFLTIVPLLLPILMWFAGIFWALARWQRHPRVSLLALLAFSLFIADLLFFTWLGQRLPLWLHTRLGRTGQELAMALGAVTACRTVLRLVPWALLLAALFMERGRADEAIVVPTDVQE